MKGHEKKEPTRVAFVCSLGEINSPGWKKAIIEEARKRKIENQFEFQSCGYAPRFRHVGYKIPAHPDTHILVSVVEDNVLMGKKFQQILDDRPPGQKPHTILDDEISPWGWENPKTVKKLMDEIIRSRDTPRS